ncbi:unnamed protein product [Phytophthora fragariaefolia]|uniref:Unnamed protein product n=1 Tax=Phytophthora fragariaefolia TaxID=1490495 RepID=A0A9W6XQ97_9STRA|nr:unnamed protein product [Phytophthora fragariaefolia]
MNSTASLEYRSKKICRRRLTGRLDELKEQRLEALEASRRDLWADRGRRTAGKGSAGDDDDATSECESTIGEADGSSSTKGKHNVVEKMFTMGVIDESGVQTKYITRKQLRKFLRMKTKTVKEPDFMLVLSNETIKQVARSLQRRDQSDNVGSAKAQRYRETDRDIFLENPAFNLLTEYKSNVFRPELPEGLPEKREIEHRIDVKDPNLAMYLQQWRQSPEQQSEIVRWVEDMVKKKLIRPKYPDDEEGRHLGRHVRCVVILHDGPDVCTLLGAHARRRQKGYCVSSAERTLGVSRSSHGSLQRTSYNAQADIEAISRLEEYEVVYDDIYVFTKLIKIEDHLDALRETLDILNGIPRMQSNSSGIA